ncbi:collagen alpha-2(I) chain-like [Branchiostoma floridae]|uniref:1-alkyl-2-acetylglycerophosphocholine esterase n=1 Tax=Branchiostoma floridae TaxID=7739 RepID=A0A9J7LE94_BRAFL|nr:collagen alpha-2(I) chain-like [Branchiostoma floridae]
MKFHPSLTANCNIMCGLFGEMAIILAFTDSICKYVSNHATFSSDILFSLNAHPGASVYDLTSDISRHPFVEPDLVFLHAGTNCLPMHRPLSRTLDDFSYLISVTKSRFPSASVVISSILPRFDSEVYDRRRSELNSHLLRLCSSQGVFLLDNGSRARRAMFSVDGLHLSRAGNISYAKYLSFSLSHYLQLHRRSCQHRFTLRGEEWPGLGTDGRSGKKDKEHPGEEPKSGEYQGQVEWARVVRQGGPVARPAPGKVEGKGPSQPRGVPVARAAPGKVEGGNAGKGPSQPRGVPVARAAPGKVEGGNAGKGPSRPREVAVASAAPGKVVGGSVGKGPSRPRGVAVARPAPGKVEGGNAGKGPSQPRGVPVARAAPGKVVGCSVGKGPSRPRGVPVARAAPGKVVGGNAGKGPSRPRGVPVPQPRLPPGKVEGGSAGKGPSRPRGGPVPKPRVASGKVEGGSVGKGPSRPRGGPVPKPRVASGKGGVVVSLGRARRVQVY